ncbi:MAG: methyltransferase domain-containing protein [Caldilineaceae bacterium]
MDSQPSHWRHSLPSFLRQRIEVNTYLMHHLLAEAAKMLPANAWVLDAGSGEGRFKPFFTHTHYIGVDLAIGDATWDYSALDAINTLEWLPFADNVFDAAVCTQVLEHLAEPEKVLREIQRVLKPGGILLLVAPQSWHEHQIPHDYFRYTSYGLRYLLGKTGYQVETMKPLGGYFWYLSFQLQQFTYWLFSRNHWLASTGLLRNLAKAGAAILFEVILPLLLFPLDSLDQVQEATLGHFCVARKNCA